MRTHTILKALAPVLLAGLPLALAEGPADDPFRDCFFPPELVMQNQQAIALDDAQRSYLKTELRETQQRFTEQQWKLDDELERFVALARPPQVDEQQALAHLDKVLAAEREVKRLQITLLVRIKNHLRPDQQARLLDIRRKAGAK